MTILRIEHVQLAMPPGREAEAREFYGHLLGIPETPKPPELARRGGVWFESGPVKIHLGAEADFHPARKAHPALLVRDLRTLVDRLREARVDVVEDLLEGHDRVYVDDPFGNRIELMAAPPVSFTPEGWYTVTPRIVAREAQQLVAFVKHVFGATGDYHPDTPAILTIGDSIVMVSDAGIRGPSPALLYVYVPDADATYRRAVEAGARSLEEPSDMPYGDRRGMVEDRWGNTWQIATRRA